MNSTTFAAACAVPRALIPLVACIALAGGAAGQTPALDGQWQTPIYCAGQQTNGWPDGSMHLNHIVVRATTPTGPELQARILTWYNPGCPIDAECPYGPCEPEAAGCPPNEGAIPEQYTLCTPPCLGDPVCVMAPLPPRLWNPRAPTTPPAYYTTAGLEFPADPEIINDCNGHTPLGDGRLLVCGGGCGPSLANYNALIFNPVALETPGTNPWSKRPQMLRRRWYPTATTIGDGRVILFAGVKGTDAAGAYIFETEPEIYDPLVDVGLGGPNPWTLLPKAAVPAPTQFDVMFPYPFMFVLPDGMILWAGHGVNTGVLDLTKPAESLDPWWNMLPPHTEADLYCGAGSAVSYAPGKVLKSGGFDGTDCLPTGITARIVFGESSLPLTASWQTLPAASGGVMTHPRKDHYLVALPDGHVLAVGGQELCGDVCLPPADPPALPDVIACGNCAPVLHAEWIDPEAADPEWTELAQMTIPRAYHATALLLPDATVMIAGGEDWFDCPPYCDSSRSVEIFKPPYLFNGAQPVISSVSVEELTCCSTFTVTMAAALVPDATRASLVRVGAPTHGFDQSQRLVPLTLEPGSTATTTLTINGPKSTNHAPPGWYMLFIINSNGVPSKAKYVKVGPCVGNLDPSCCNVDGADLAMLLAAWTPSEPSGSTACAGAIMCPANLNHDNLVNGEDLAILLANWGPCGGGTAYACGESGGGSAPSGGGGESATAGGPSGADCGGSIDLFQHWLDTGDMAAFWQWYNCMVSLAGSGATQ